MIQSTTTTTTANTALSSVIRTYDLIVNKRSLIQVVNEEQQTTTNATIKIIDDISGTIFNRILNIAPGAETDNQLTMNECLPRIAGVITVCSALCMFIMALKRRDRLFHRLVLGMSVHLLIQGAFRIYGTSAVPVDDGKDGTTEVPYKASGTVATCTVQGFFSFLCINTAIFYYCGFSVYSYVIVLNNFDPSKYNYIEKFIHVFVHIFPLAFALYIVSKQGFNNSGYGFCSVASHPLGCEETTSDVECDRGPNTSKELRQLQLLDLCCDIFAIVFPTIVMMILSWKVHARQTAIIIRAKTVFMQSLFYLVVLYITIIPFLVGEGIEIVSSSSSRLMHQYGFFISATIMFSLFGFFTLIFYIYFSIPEVSTTVRSFLLRKGNNNGKTPPEPLPPPTSSIATITDDNNTFRENYIFSCRDSRRRLDCSDTSDYAIPNPTAATTTPTIPEGGEEGKQRQRSSRTTSEQKYDFNIFDGTNAKGAYADFVFDGDENDLQLDDAETRKWSSVQNHI